MTGLKVMGASGPARAVRAILQSVAFLMICASAEAAPTIYFSPAGNGADPGNITPSLPLGGVRDVDLWINAGANATNNGGSHFICNRNLQVTPPVPGGNGDETCGIHFKARVSGDLRILSFSHTVGVARSSIASDEKELNAVISTVSAPILPGPQRIGTISVDASGAGGSALISFLETVDADLDLKAGVPRPIFNVPEPGAMQSILAGIFLLVLLGTNRMPGRISHS